jgi:hypothetical protein
MKVMRFVSPYSVLFTVNPEPIYGLLPAFAILGDSEKRNEMFYVGPLLLLTVVTNGILKKKSGVKRIS